MIQTHSIGIRFSRNRTHARPHKYEKKAQRIIFVLFFFPPLSFFSLSLSLFLINYLKWKEQKKTKTNFYSHKNWLKLNLTDKWIQHTKKNEQKPKIRKRKLTFFINLRFYVWVYLSVLVCVSFFLNNSDIEVHVWSNYIQIVGSKIDTRNFTIY